MKPILDACCGSRMFWFNHDDPRTVFCDNRRLSERLCDGRVLRIDPDIQCDFKALPFPDESFRLVVFDPPHLKTAGPKSWQAKKYGKLPPDWGERAAPRIRRVLSGAEAEWDAGVQVVGDTDSSE